MLSKDCVSQINSIIDGCDDKNAVIREFMRRIPSQFTEFYGNFTPVKGYNIKLLQKASITSVNGFHCTEDEKMNDLVEHISQMGVVDSSEGYEEEEEDEKSLDLISDVPEDVDYVHNPEQIQELYDLMMDDADDPNDGDFAITLKENEITYNTTKTSFIYDGTKVSSVKSDEKLLQKSLELGRGAHILFMSHSKNLKEIFVKVLPVYYEVIYKLLGERMPDFPFIEEIQADLFYHIFTHQFQKDDHYFFKLIKVFSKIQPEMCFYPWLSRDVMSVWHIKMRKKDIINQELGEYTGNIYYEMSDGFETDVDTKSTENVSRLFVSCNYIKKIPENMDNLQTFDCSYNLVKYIPYYPLLTNLNCAGNPVREIDEKLVRQLTHINISDMDEKIVDKICSMLLNSEIRDVTCTYNKLNVHTFAKTIQILNIENCTFSSSDINLQGDLSQIKMSNCTFNNSTITFPLEILQIEAENIKGVKKIIFNNTKRLLFGNFSNSHINEIHFPVKFEADVMYMCNIIGMKKIELREASIGVLNLNNTSLTSFFARKCTMEELNLDKCGITSQTMPDLYQSVIKEISLNGNDFRDEFDLYRLRCRLKMVHLEGCGLTPENTFLEKPRVVYVNFRNNSLTTLPHLHRDIETIILSHNNFSYQTYVLVSSPKIYLEKGHPKIDNVSYFSEEDLEEDLE
ncbi:MAG TPA: hypothetical protein VLE02_00975 [Nitrosarchaeum sp.]|nr:hypothetical protein [Nitrosarchaeum sp.]